MSVTHCNISTASHFDWYQATVHCLADDLITEVAKMHPDGDIQDGRGRNNYKHSTSIVLPDGDVAAVVYHGGENGAPNVQGSSAHAEPLAKMLRSVFAHQHEVTRADVCADMMAPGLWDALHPLCQQVVRQYRLKGRMQLPDDLSEGRTYYMGSPTSQAMARMYEKGKEQLLKTGDPVFKGMLDWVRVELQVRPKKENRTLFAHVTPSQAWGFTRWSIDLSSKTFDLEAAKVGFSMYRKSADERTKRHMAAQYRKLFMRWAESNGGSWEALGRQLRDLVEEINYERKRSSQDR